MHAQEYVNEVFIDAVELSPAVAPLMNTINEVDGITGETEAKDIVDYRKSRKYKEHTVHVPMKALTLSELKQVQGQDLENIETSTEENNKLIIGNHESE